MNLSHFHTFTVVKLLLFHIRQNTGYDFFCIGDVSIYRFPKWLRTTGRNNQSSIINLQPSIIVMSDCAETTANKRVQRKTPHLTKIIYLTTKLSGFCLEIHRVIFFDWAIKIIT